LSQQARQAEAQQRARAHGHHRRRQRVQQQREDDARPGARQSHADRPPSLLIVVRRHGHGQAKRRRPAKERADEQVGGAGLLKREQQDVVGMQAQGDARKDAGQRKAHW